MRRGGLIAPVVSCSHKFKSQTEISIKQDSAEIIENPITNLFEN